MLGNVSHGKGLPTLSEVEAQYRKNLTEEDDLTKQSLTALSTVCEKCKSDLEAAFNQTEIGNADAKNVMQANAMVLMAAICTYISDIQSLREMYPEYSLDDLVIENDKYYPGYSCKIKTKRKQNQNKAQDK
jgi:hypothetical protein